MGKPGAKTASKEDVQLAFGLAVKELRVERELTQEALASEADLHFTYVSSVERGQRNLSLHNIYRLAAALGVSPSTLLLRSERKLRW